MPPPKYNSSARRSAVRRAQRRIRLHTTMEAAPVASQVAREVWKARRPKMVAAALVLLLVAGLFAFFNTDLFYVFDFDVVNTRYLNRNEVERASGFIGYNIFFIDARAVEQAVEKLPEVKSAHVTTRIPNQLTIEVEERKPQITWLRGNEAYWVDADGIGFKARANLAELPTVRDLDQVAVKPGQRVNPAAIAAVRALREAWLEAPRAMEWSAARGLSLTDERGWKIYFGDADQMAGKVAALKALLPWLLAQKATVKFIDLSKGDPYFQ